MLRSSLVTIFLLLACTSVAHAQVAVKKYGIVPYRTGESRLVSPDVSPICPNPKPLYYGGPVISNVHVVPVLWNSNVNAAIGANITQFFADATVSPWFDVMSEYAPSGSTVSGGMGGSGQSIGRGTATAAVTIVPVKCPASTTTSCKLTDAQLQTEINLQVTNNVLPQPVLDAGGNPNTLYMVFFPANVSLTGPEGAGTSCTNNGFCAYHNTGLLGMTQTPLLYGAVMDEFTSQCSTGCGDNATQLENETSVASHEMSEAITDADIGLDLQNSYAYPAAWGDNSCGEIADICDDDGDGFTITVSGRSWVVQQLWSKVKNQCVGTALAPKFIVTAPASTPAAMATAFTLTAQNPAGTKTIDTAYAGVVHFTSTDAGAVLPADFTFVPADLGTQVFSATFATDGSQTITATDILNGNIIGTSDAILVSQAATVTDVATVCPTTFVENQSIALTATVSGSNPSGAVGFADDTDTLCNNVVLSGGAAACQTPTFSVLGAGTSSVYDITASYSGDSNNLSSVSSPALELTVLKASDVLFRGGFEQTIAGCPTH